MWFLTKQHSDSRSKIGEATVASAELIGIGILGVIDKDARDAIGGMSGLGGAITIEEFFGVAMISGDYGDTTKLMNGLDDTLQRDIDGFHCGNCWLKLAKMANHVATWEINAQKIVLFGFDSSNELVGDLGTFHPWTSIEWLGIGRNLFIDFPVRNVVAVAIEIIGDMTKLRLQRLFLPENIIGYPQLTSFAVAGSKESNPILP